MGPQIYLIILITRVDRHFQIDHEKHPARLHLLRVEMVFPSACSQVWVQCTRCQIHKHLAQNRIHKCTLKQMGYTRPQQNGHNVQNCPNTSNNSQQRSGETKSDELLNDVELPTVLDNMVKFIEDSLEDKHSENELGNIHIGHSPTRLPPSLARPRSASGERQTPLYLRRAPGQGSSSQTQPNLSYASALRSQLPVASSFDETATSSSVNRESEELKQQQQLLKQQQRRLQLGLGIPVEVAATSISSKNTDPLLPMSAAGGSRPLSQLMTTSLLPPPTTDPLTPEMSQPADPLDLLKNLKIKASPGTQALYQYFS